MMRILGWCEMLLLGVVVDVVIVCGWKCCYWVRCETRYLVLDVVIVDVGICVVCGVRCGNYWSEVVDLWWR